ncbi:MAG: SAM-dependent methyltransferase [Actinomycetota bacterium]
MSAAESIRARIRREGPITFDTFMELALYDAEGGFFASGGRARRDFITSPEVGSLFGACVARAIDEHWRMLGAPDPYVVVEAGAGSGRLARDVLRGAPDCRHALRYLLVERSAPLRIEQAATLPLEPPDEALGPFFHRATEDDPVPVPAAGPIVAALEDLPAQPFTGVVLANELLDNLPFGIAQWDGRQWSEVRIALGGDDRFVELLVPADDLDLPADLAVDTRVPIARGIHSWLSECARVLRDGAVVLFDHTMTEPRPGWLRTYRGNARGAGPLAEPGTQDITSDVWLPDLVAHAARVGLHTSNVTTQADWLRAHGIEQLVDEGRQLWDEGAARGDLAALTGLSRVREAEALLDPTGLGAHRVVTLAAD